MKTAEEIFIKHFYNYAKKFTPLVKDDEIEVNKLFSDLMESAMEEYAEQFKYDYSQSCKCTDSTGSTWCCNICGLPLDNNSPSKNKTK